MKATAKLLVAALAVAGLTLAVDVQAQSRGSHGGASHGWSGSHGGSWGHGGGWGRSGGYWRPRVGLFIGAPLLIGGFGWPYYYDYWGYPRTTVIYRDVEPAYFEEPGELMPSTEVPRGEGAPSQAPLYMNYCESAKAYFPKVTSCPEGWKLATPSR